MVLYLHRSERADYLAEALGEVLAKPMDDPMAREVVAVPTRGVERWLAQRLAHRLGALGGHDDGVCANIDFPFPGNLVAAAMAAVWPDNATAAGATGPWAPARCTWPLMEVVDEHLDDEFLWPLAAHLRVSSPKGPSPRRFTAVRHLAELYDRYATHRPEMVLAWAKGGGGSLPLGTAEEAWQAQLWWLLRQRIGSPSPAERFEAAPALIEAAPDKLDLPSRVCVFGLTRLPASHLRVLKAVAAHRDVHLFLLHPSEALWAKMAARVPRPARVWARSEDSSARLPANPLLRSWGRDAREMQLVLASEALTGGEHRPVECLGGTLLALVQADIRADRQPPGLPGPGGDARPLLADGDDSLRVHACHGRARQVEVVREAVLHLMAADPTLQPRDVIVMCPDIELFAPLVQASFGAASLAGAPALRARLADRSLRQTNPLLAVAAQLLELAGSRVTAVEVLDFASREPVSRRFGFDQDQLSQIGRWLAASGVRWGLDLAHRDEWKLHNLADGTWRAGLDRLLLGVAMTDEEGRLFGGTLPFDDVASGDIELLGRLAELVERLRAGLAGLRGPQAPRRWAEALIAATDMVSLPPPTEQWQADQLHGALEGATDGAGPDDGAAMLDLAEARSLLADQLRGRPTRANFRTGDMTICTLVPMRSVPHRVVCLLGLDDGVFPRAGATGGDDLMLARPQVGDPDVTSEDRQLLLDALLAAREHLVVTYEGHDQHLNRHRPPCVPVSELLDVVDRTVRLSDPARPAREAVLVHHPLQPFDPRNFEPGALGVPGPWRFDEAQLLGAKASRGTRQARPPFLVGRLPPLDSPTVQLAALVRFLEHPVRSFLRERLGLYQSDLPEQLRESLPIEMAPLERWALGDRLLAACLHGVSLERAIGAERGRGLLPPGALGEAALVEVKGIVEALVAEVDRLPCAKAAPGLVQVKLVLPDGTGLVGTVPGVHESAVMRFSYAKLGPKHRLRAWAHFLALSAMCPELGPSAVTVGQAQGSTGAKPRTSVVTLPPLAHGTSEVREAALEGLHVLVDLYRRGMTEPLPMYCATSAAWAAAALDEGGPLEPARSRWASTFDEIPGEDADPCHVLVLGEAFPFEELLAAAPAPDEKGKGWAMSERTRFGRLSLRLWGPLLAHELRRER